MPDSIAVIAQLDGSSISVLKSLEAFESLGFL